MNRGEAELSGVWAKFLVLGLGLLFLGKQEVVEPTLEVRGGGSVGAMSAWPSLSLHAGAEGAECYWPAYTMQLGKSAAGRVDVFTSFLRSCTCAAANFADCAVLTLLRSARLRLCGCNP
jgi:hypothetical protein